MRSVAIYAATLLLVRPLHSFANPSRTREAAKCRSSSQPVETVSDIPLVFLHGIKGSHLKDPRGKRRWLTLQGLLNLPPKSDFHPSRDLSLPLTYTNEVQDRGDLSVDGSVDNIIQISDILQMIPVYGHVTKLLRDSGSRYTIQSASGTCDEFPARPTAVFNYDWRCNLAELSDEFHGFCCKHFPEQPVQVLAHSLGGLIAFAAMRKYPEKYKPGAVMVGVPFGTGIQYLQDLHLGYFTEVGRNRQFLPLNQFTYSSHWIFFPTNPEQQEMCFVDVAPDTTPFLANEPSIGKALGDGFQLEPVPGEPVVVDFFDVESWEKNRIGIFDLDLDENLLRQYRNHMRAQFTSALEFRKNVLMPLKEDETMPPLTVLASDKIPTVNQYLRRKNEEGRYEYDYCSGRRVPGDGRVFFSGAFPLVPHKSGSLDSPHAKQFTWEENGGSLGTIMNEVQLQLEEYSSKAGAEAQAEKEGTAQ